MLSSIRFRPFCVLLTLGGLLGAGVLAAQDVQMVPDKQDQESADKAQTDKDEKDKDADQEVSTTLKTSVNVVQLFFNVKEKKGGLIPNLPKDNFQVFEDGTPQTIKYFSAESNLPLTLGILIDTSASQERVRDMDMAFVMSFDVRVDLLQDFTGNVRRLKTALNSVKINTGGTVSSLPGMGGGPVPTANIPRGTLLYDAVYLASHDQMAQQVDRKAMILLTDGEDQGSQYKIRDAVEAAQKADTIVYVLLCADRGFYWSQGASFGGDSSMKKLTSETG